MDWMTTLNQVLSLITGLCGLVGTSVGVFFAVKNFINQLKAKSKQEAWNTIMEMADAAMQAAEKTKEKGADKKTMVIESVKSGCKSIGLNFDEFIDQLNAYIDCTIKFVNDMTKKTPARKTKNVLVEGK